MGHFVLKWGTKWELWRTQWIIELLIVYKSIYYQSILLTYWSSNLRRVCQKCWEHEEGGSSKFDGGGGQYMREHGGLQTVLKNACEGVHLLVKCFRIPRLLIFQSTIWFPFLLGLVIIYTHIFNLLEKCFHSYCLFFSSLPFLYNLSHRLTELNVSLFYLKTIFFKNIYWWQPHVNVQAIKLNFIRQIFNNKWHKMKSRILKKFEWIKN